MTASAWAWSALALFAVWATAAFGLRAVLQRRRTGDSGFRGISGAPGSAAWWAGVLFVLALLGGAAAPLAALGGMPHVPGGESLLVHALGGVVALLGATATLLSQNTMGASWRVGVDDAERTDLVTGGVFGYVRNPVFTAMIGTAAGLSLMVLNLIAVASLALLLAAVEMQVRVVEEPYLAGVHGSSYADYAGRTGRFVPGVGQGHRS
ncbi:isoprenylcysteine carboxylmethyltransferase family protein [Streptomyces armeniacus]|uniref:Isoprenylcysteine carboxylmethyltransferase family protein n=1 Tax=Streptomyces armeniacus TaxID=83291 RepID=A0A345XS03_9ACTN|nr:isoprenylcysteine carboxylmethyltransferase family protein [Streptomyces armeniacus]AXK34419.1 isoprenylcysteine carboxylmethyltransferase family protein [Streptomyces armeniacus]